MMPPTPDNQPSMGSQGDGNDGSKADKRVSVMKSVNNKSMLLRTQTGDFDHNRWLFELKAKYGIGSAFWQDDDDQYGTNGGVTMSDFMDKPWKPLTRKTPIKSSILSPYRFLILVRLVIMFFFLGWRWRNLNPDAMWLWGISCVCESWFAFSWLLDNLPKLKPINRSTHLVTLHEKFEQVSPSNPTGQSDLSGVDLFVSTVDPDKEPPLVTANTILSIMVANYPVEKLSASISDYGGVILTFEAMAEAIRFAKDRRWIKREYDEFKVRINGLPETILKRCDIHNKREIVKEKALPKRRTAGRCHWIFKSIREKRPGFDHNKKAEAMNGMVRASIILSNGPFILNLDCDHYFYNSMAIKEGICFMMDRGGDRICYIQFQQLVGVIGTRCMFRRYAPYGFHPSRANEYTGVFGQNNSPADNIQTKPAPVDDEFQPLNVHPDLDVPKRFGESMLFTESIPVAEYQGRPLADHISVKNGRPPGALLTPRQPLDAPTVTEAVAVISCWYENTDWGGKIGWIYGSVTEDVVTGYRMHNGGWRSVYCVTKRDAFRGTAPINLTDRLHQVLRWATGSVDFFFSRNNPLFATRRLKFLQRIAYLNVGFYPFTSILLVIYCFLPALSLFSDQFIVQGLNIAFLMYLLVITLNFCCISILEVRWSGISLEEFWRNKQFWVIGGSSAHLVAVLQGLLKVFTGIEISFTLTSKSAGEDEDDVYAELYLVKWTSLFIVPLTIIIVTLLAIVIGVSRTIYSVIPQWTQLFGDLFFAFWVLCHMYRFVKGLMGRRVLGSEYNRKYTHERMTCYSSQLVHYIYKRRLSSH
ncbi:Cellulose synthase-like protein D2 [Hibiscus syriacus]|uniref:Cellulose synthase-like protein D2 n=1 Tax=Hibiscus syriacus TaxID=106335 RepID=A0A6A3C0E9_HIBSY|nr:Cellulose synthase-like protein D2 [Hibiscus syriacus]